MSIILNKFLAKKYEDITAINFEELCTWSLWPSYFRLWRGKLAAFLYYFTFGMGMHVHASIEP